MKNYKFKIVLWSFIGILSLIMVVVFAVLISYFQNTINLSETVVRLDNKIIETYKIIQSYSIGGLAFFSLLTPMSIIISYAGYKSWKYAELF
ncbi:hypothetical protein [Mycoplasmopsis sturni]|uniref:hypothetical protein n=1 Tax=Mycoplasmopsis sturni TaxID=39047 RepID=UPI000562FFFB|nr:hypothetical protein [Mycoplasmopsis sturni]